MRALGVYLLAIPVALNLDYRCRSRLRKTFIVHADEILTAFLELEWMTRGGDSRMSGAALLEI